MRLMSFNVFTFPSRHPVAGRQRQADDLHDLIQTLRDSRPGSNEWGKTLSKDFSWTGGYIAEKFSHGE